MELRSQSTLIKLKDQTNTILSEIENENDDEISQDAGASGGGNNKKDGGVSADDGGDGGGDAGDDDGMLENKNTVRIISPRQDSLGPKRRSELIREVATQEEEQETTVDGASGGVGVGGGGGGGGVGGLRLAAMHDMEAQKSLSDITNYDIHLAGMDTPGANSAVNLLQLQQQHQQHQQQQQQQHQQTQSNDGISPDYGRYKTTDFVE